MRECQIYWQMLHIHIIVIAMVLFFYDQTGNNRISKYICLFNGIPNTAFVT